jgi:hypothetical protein
MQSNPTQNWRRRNFCYERYSRAKEDTASQRAGAPEKELFEKPKPKPTGVYRGFQALFIHFIPEKLILSRLLSKTS